MLVAAFPELIYAYGNYTETPYTFNISFDINQVDSKDVAIRTDDFHGI